jgi:hypothetical protein
MARLLEVDIQRIGPLVVGGPEIALWRVAHRRDQFEILLEVHDPVT